jgi:hypothetical protein
MFCASASFSDKHPVGGVAGTKIAEIEEDRLGGLQQEGTYLEPANPMSQIMLPIKGKMHHE